MTAFLTTTTIYSDGVYNVHSSLKKRFTRALREFDPKADDTFVLVTLENLQSLVLADLLLAVEEEYNVKIHHLHLGKKLPLEVHQRLSSSPLIVSSKTLQTKPENYSQVKVKVASTISLYPPDALYVLPFTADDLACYFLLELLNGNMTGLVLEAEARTAYPLYSTTNREIQGIFRDSSLETTLYGNCGLLAELEGRIALQAFGNFYVQTFIKGYYGRFRHNGLRR